MIVKHNDRIVKINDVFIHCTKPGYKERLQEKIKRYEELKMPDVVVDALRHQLELTPEKEYQEVMAYRKEKEQYFRDNPMVPEVVQEIVRRYDLMRENTSFKRGIAFGYTGSFMHFCMGLNILGDSYDSEDWQDDAYQEAVMPAEDYRNGRYDAFLSQLHREMLDTITNEDCLRIHGETLEEYKARKEAYKNAEDDFSEWEEEYWND